MNRFELGSAYFVNFEELRLKIAGEDGFLSLKKLKTDGVINKMDHFPWFV